MSKVYVTQENHRLNYSDAERYGEVVFITNFEYSPNVNSKRNMSIQNDICDTLVHYNSEEDFFLLSGDPIIMVLAFYHIATKDGNASNRIRLLKWDNQDRSYNQIILTF